MNKLAVKNLNLSIHRTPILQDISFSANKGDVIAIMGRSGSGKSTLLRCMNVLTSPDSGIIHIDDFSIHFELGKTYLTNKEIIRLRKKIGMVFQQYNLWPHMTVLNNLIEAPVHVLKQNRDQTIEEAKILLGKVGLLDKLEAYPARLSGGQQQRAAIARALMMKPDIMLFDEPTSALDPGMIKEVLHVMQKLAKEGMTMLIATHQPTVARRLANKIIFLEKGKILEQGNSETFFDSPQSAELIQFIENMND